MFNNYNGRRASRGERGGGGGSRIKLREKERTQKVDEKRARQREMKGKEGGIWPRKEREAKCFRTKRNGQQRGCMKRLKRVVKVREGRGER